MKDYRDSALYFTDQGWEQLYKVVDSPAFKGNEAEVIFESLMNSRPKPFGEYLKRYLYEAAALTDPYSQVPRDEYLGILRAAFRDTKTPISFEPSSTRPGAAFARWLEQEEVSRSTVLLLGFGLSLSLAEVNDFLTKGIRQEGLNKADPRELICSWCYDKAYGFFWFEKLWDIYETERWGDADPWDAPLMNTLKKLKEAAVLPQGSTARQVFFELYNKTRINLLTENNPKEKALELSTYGEISPADIENALYEGVPLDENGNLMKQSLSALKDVFPPERLTRQRLHGLLQGSVQLSRSDLINLCFLNWAARPFSNPQIRFAAFADETNRLLNQCGFSELYSTAPYELYLMMCLLCEKPLAVLAQVWERAYGDRDQS